MMPNERDPASGAIVAILATVAGIGIAILDMTADNLPLVLVLVVVVAIAFGAVAPRWALLSGAFLGMMHPIAQFYALSFNLRLPHPMHGFYYGVLTIGPAIVAALLAMLARDWVDEFRESRRPVVIEQRSPLTSRRRG